jgi:hypothetical protein
VICHLTPLNNRKQEAQAQKISRDSCQVAATIPLVQIQHHSDRLIGCLACNLWRRDKSAFIVELEVEDWEVGEAMMPWMS